MAVAAPQLPSLTPPAHIPPSLNVARWSSARWALLLATLTLAAFVIAGWHPYAEDGGMYVARVQLRLDPSLYPHFHSFVREPLPFSLFEPTLAAMVRCGMPLDWSLLLMHLLTIALTLIAARMILQRLMPDERAQLAGLALLAAWLTIPVAATSLLLVDPYLTARSFATPFTLFAVAFALDAPHNLKPHPRRPMSLLCVTLVTAFHPLMGVYAAMLLLLLWLLQRSRWLWLLVPFTALAAAGLAQGLAPPASPAERIADHSRYYWFLSQWHAYELAGIVCPLLIVAWFALKPRAGFTRLTCLLARAMLAFTLTGVILALCLAHEAFRSHVIARLQPLRTLSVLYALLPMLLGAWLAHRTSRWAARKNSPFARRAVRSIPLTLAVLSAAIFGCVQHATFAATTLLELPGVASHNPWVSAFLWARDNTSPDALFALDARYVSLPGEDAQNFRAISRRSALPDFSKDGGEAANVPALAGQWRAAVLAQENLSSESDTARRQHLDALHPGWLVLLSSAHTTAPCPYDNNLVKVCRLITVPAVFPEPPASPTPPAP